MARSLPILGQVKKENMRWVFASCFGHWCQAIIGYLANIEEAPDKSITRETFSSEVYPAYEVMFNSWITTSKESKVKLATIHAIGQMCAVMPREQFEGQLVRLIPIYIKMYSKEKSHLPVTEGLATIIQVAVQSETPVLEPHLQIILNTLHPLTCQATTGPAVETVNAGRNVHELLRCFELLGTAYSEQLCAFLLARLDVVKNKLPQTRAGTLHILKHLITRLADKLEEKKELLLSGVRPLLDTETSIDVRKVLCQVIIAMASQQYLVLEGSLLLPKFQFFLGFFFLFSSFLASLFFACFFYQFTKKQVINTIK